MKPQDHHDTDLQALWQSEAPTFDAAEIRGTVEHDRKLQRLTVNLCLLGGLGVLVFTLWVEARGVTRVPFLISGLIATSLVWQVVVTIRARRRMPDAARLAPVGLLRHAVARARTTLRNARLLYAGNPFGVAVGFGLGPFLVGDSPSLGSAAPAMIALSLLFAAMVAAGAVFGVRMAQAARRRIAVLEDRLRRLEAEL